jgi:hypothetical protein
VTTTKKKHPEMRGLKKSRDVLKFSYSRQRDMMGDLAFHRLTRLKITTEIGFINGTTGSLKNLRPQTANIPGN